jgi:hypothetical protein
MSKIERSMQQRPCLEQLIHRNKQKLNQTLGFSAY